MATCDDPMRPYVLQGVPRSLSWLQFLMSSLCKKSFWGRLLIQIILEGFYNFFSSILSLYQRLKTSSWSGVFENCCPKKVFGGKQHTWLKWASSWCLPKNPIPACLSLSALLRSPRYIVLSLSTSRGIGWWCEDASKLVHVILALLLALHLKTAQEGKTIKNQLDEN